MTRPPAPADRSSSGPPARLGLARAHGVRLRARRIGLLRAGSSRTPARAVDRIFRSPLALPRPLVVHVPGPAVRPVDLHLSITLPPAQRTFRQPPAVAASSTQGRAAEPPTLATVGPAAPRLVLLVERAARASAPRLPAAASSTAPALPGTPAVVASPVRTPAPAPRPVRLVHRTQPAAPSAPPVGVAQPAPTAPGLAVRWAGAEGAAAAVPLTGRDVPAVVDRVVREIEGRLTADRERRGWPG